MSSDDTADARQFPLDGDSADAVTGQRRDSVDAHADGATVVSISDIHGYLDAARSALSTLGDHPNYDPVVTVGDDGRLHWAGNDYVLVFNGDLVDRGPANTETVATVARLAEQAPAGRVRVTLGNHEMAILTQGLFRWDSWFSGKVGPDARRSLVDSIRQGHVVAAYEGHGRTYAHAGANDPYDTSTVNDTLAEAATQLADHVGGDRDLAVQQQIVDDYPAVLGMGHAHLKGPGAGLIWLDFQHLQHDAPPQVVGHTRHETVTAKGAVVCENVIRDTVDTPGGEAVLVETPDDLVTLRRTADGGVDERTVATH